MVDKDGSLTDGEPDSKVVAASEIYDPNECTEMHKFSGLVLGAVCNSTARFARVELNHVHPSSLVMKDMTFSTSFGTSTVPFRGQGVGDLHVQGWMAVLPTGMATTLLVNMTSVTDITYVGTVQDLEVRNYLQTLYASQRDNHILLSVFFNALMCFLREEII